MRGTLLANSYNVPSYMIIHVKQPSKSLVYIRQISNGSKHFFYGYGVTSILISNSIIMLFNICIICMSNGGINIHNL